MKRKSTYLENKEINVYVENDGMNMIENTLEKYSQNHQKAKEEGNNEII